MRLLRPLLAAVSLTLVLAAPAVAQEPAASAAADDNRLGLALSGGLREDGRQYVMKRQRVVVQGTAPASENGKQVKVEIFRSGKAATTLRTTVRGGAFSVTFLASRAARYTAQAELEPPSAGTEPSVKRTVHAISPRARRGGRGRDVKLLQQGLARLGFVTSRGGRYDDATGRAVLAFRKTNRLRRVTSANQSVFAKLFRGEGGFKLRYPRAGKGGKHVEFDWSRQVLVLARGGKPVRIYHTSSGAPSTPTVFGSFRFYRFQWGTNAKGMVNSAYFIRGYAIHGYKSVPNHPASHGCLRVPIPNSRSIARWISLGDPIFTYR